MAERLSNIGYFAMKKESTKGTAVTPNTYVPLYEESIFNNLNLNLDTPILGNKVATYQALMGQRDHKGEVTVIAEPNTAARFFDMLLTKGSTTGANPYTHPFTLDNSTNPNAYTVDIQRGQIVFRFIGAEASQIGIDFDDNKMLFKVAISALKSFSIREIASVSTNTLTLTTNYDPSPTDGLVTSDLVRIFKADGSVVDTTVSSIGSGTQVTVGSASGVAGGDFVALRAATPSSTTVTPFLWARSEFRFGSTASGALSATQTRVEQGSAWTVKHMFEDEAGAKRSGAFDPAALVRTLGDVEFNTKIFFDTPDEFNRFLSLTKRACVVRHFSETGYELRLTMNNLKVKENNPPVKSGEIVYQEITYVPTYDTSDGQAFSATVINAISSI